MGLQGFLKFSAVGSIEGARWIQMGNLMTIKMQQLIDCDLTNFL